MMKPTARLLALGAFLAAAGCTRSSYPAIQSVASVARTAADCQQLRALRLENTTISAAEAVRGSFTPPGSRDTIRNLPAFCRVAGEIRPTSDSHIAFEVWLPLENWNGKFAGVGNGGWAGTISYAGPLATLSDQVRRGYAVASTNTGHTGDGGDARFAYGHPERLVDFGWRSVHEMTIAGKAVVNAFYGRPARYAYWMGCSTGGKQALTEAQRFPGDYDGIVAGAPATNFVPLMIGTLGLTITAIGDSSRYLLGPARTLLRESVMKECDKLDGVEDGLIENPRKCLFDPASIQCGATGAGGTCLTAAQVAAVKRIYDGVEDPTTGRKLAPGLARGSEFGWGGWAAPGSSFAHP